MSDSSQVQERLRRAEQIIASLAKGVAILDTQSRVVWANSSFRNWCPQDPIGIPFLDALGPICVTGKAVPTLPESLNNHPISFQLQQRDKQYFDVVIRPFHDADASAQWMALCDDVSDTVSRQQKLDALHRAGQELADLDPAQLSEMNVECRVELLKENLRKHIHNLLNYNVIEIRLLHPQTGKLEPLLEEGMTPEAVARQLYAKEVGNGVTGYVAATGKSYMCVDTATDPHYIVGASGAKSSMTVPIIYQDQVIGTFNVESPTVNAFTQEDLQFAELFSRELGHALHTLDLLSAQQLCTAHQSIEAINREIALPTDEMLTLASTLLGKGTDNDTETTEALKRIMLAARQVKNAIKQVGNMLTLEEESKDVRSSKLRGMRILVIEDDETIRRSAHSLLERQGCEVETAATGQQGLAMAHASNYDAVLTGIRHPDMRGTIVYRTLRTTLPNARVILTQAFGYDSEHTVVNARQDGYWLPVIFKPFRLEQLLNALTVPPPTSGSGLHRIPSKSATN